MEFMKYLSWLAEQTGNSHLLRPVSLLSLQQISRRVVFAVWKKMQRRTFATETGLLRDAGGRGCVEVSSHLHVCSTYCLHFI